MPTEDNQKITLSSEYLIYGVEGEPILISKSELETNKAELKFKAFTWAWVGAAIAQGIIAWQAGKIFSDLTDQGVHIDKLVEKTLKGVSEIIHEALQEQAMREIRASLKALQRTISHYMNSPETSEDRLHHATFLGSQVVAQIESMGLVGHHSYIVAIGLFIAILEERVKRYGETEKKNIIEVLDNSCQHANSLHNAWWNWTKGRFSPDVYLVAVSFGLINSTVKGNA